MALPLPSLSSSENQALMSLQILDSQAEPEFDRLARIVAYSFGTKIALISFLDDKRAFIKAAFGWEIREQELSDCICKHVVQRNDLLVIRDASMEPRFATMACVRQVPQVRFYAGAPLHWQNQAVGALSIMDDCPRNFSSQDRLQLLEFAQLVEETLAQRYRRMQQQETQAALQEAYYEARDILESITDGFFALDRDWHFVYVNQEAEHLLKKHRNELLGRNIWQVFAESVGTVFEERCQKVLRQGGKSQFETWYPPLKMWFRVNVYAASNGICVYFSDISSKMEAEQELKQLNEYLELRVAEQTRSLQNINESLRREVKEKQKACEQLKGAEEQLRLFIKHTPAAVAMFDRNLRYLQVSERWKQDYQLQGTQLVGKSHYEIFPEIQEMPLWQEIHRQCLKGKVMKCEEDIFIRADGTQEWIRWEIVPWYEGIQVAGLIMFTELITDRIQARQQLKELNETLEHQVKVRTREVEETNRRLRESLARERELSELKTRFVSLVSHEFRTPLAMMLSSAQLAKRWLDKDSFKVSHHLGRIQEGINEMKNLLEDVLLYGRLEAGKANAIPSEDSVLLQTVEQILADLQEGLGMQHRFRLENRLQHQGLRCNKRLCGLIISNLLTNAVKYSPHGSTILLTLQEAEAELVITVADQGMGIPTADLPYIFEPFHRASNTQGKPGTGLGLSLSKRAAERYQGNLEVAQTSPQGTTFRFTLPLSKPAPPP